MPSATDKALVVAEFDNSLYPSGAPTLEDAWVGFYQVLWWCHDDMLHVNEASALDESRTWQEKARIAKVYMAQALGIPEADVCGIVDRMIRLPRWTHQKGKKAGQAMQRNNPVGHGLRMLLSEVLRRWGDPRFDYPEEERPSLYFPGIVLPGRSQRAAID